MPSPQQRSRCGVVSGVVLFLGCQLALAYVIQYHRPAWHDPVHAAKLQRLETRLDRAPPDNQSIVVLGSSRAACGIWGSQVEEAFPPSPPTSVTNFAVTTGGPVLQGMTLNRLLERGIQPDVAVVEVLPALLARGTEGVEATQYPNERYLLREHAYARRWGASAERLRTVALQSLLLPGYAHRVRLWQDIDQGWLPPRCRYEWTEVADDWGTVPLGLPDPPPAEVRQRALEVARQQYQTCLSTFELGSTGRAALAELLQRCRQHGIRVILVWMPEGPTFRSWYRPGAEAEFLAYLAHLHSGYGCPIIDAHDWLPEQDFLDSHHLLPGAGRNFSRRLGREVAALLGPARPPATNGQAARAVSR